MNPVTPKLRVVLDTNVYIAALGHPKRKNAKILAAAGTGRYQFLISPAIMRELARVLREVLDWRDEAVQRAV